MSAAKVDTKVISVIESAADPPLEFVKHTRACFRCKLVKTFEQARVPARRSIERDHLVITRAVISRADPTRPPSPR
jgi:hypothetical protein